MKCLACDGEGKVANTEDKEPWSMWSSLPPGSDLMVKLGFVKPMNCEECNGTGEIIQKENSTI